MAFAYTINPFSSSYHSSWRGLNVVFTCIAGSQKKSTNKELFDNLTAITQRTHHIHVVSIPLSFFLSVIRNQEAILQDRCWNNLFLNHILIIDSYQNSSWFLLYSDQRMLYEHHSTNTYSFLFSSNIILSSTMKQPVLIASETSTQT